MTRIARIEMYHVAVPLEKPFYPSWLPGYPQTENRFDLVRVVTDDGVDGFSAAPAMGHERRGFGELIAPYLIGQDPTDMALMSQRLREVSYLGLRNYWIEPAFWDIAAKLQGVSVCELLGGKPGEIRLYASTGEIKTPEARIEEALARYEEGFRAIKLRVHDFDEDEDIRHIQETALAVGDRMKIGVDANQGWRVTIVSDAPLWNLDRAKRFADACAEAGLAWIEEPLPMDQYEDLTALTRYSDVPIAGGELNSGGLPELKMMIERRCYDIFQPDAVMAGGIGQVMEVVGLCREHGLRFTPHTWTNGIGFAINLQLMAASGFAEDCDLEYPLSPPSWTVDKRDAILSAPFQHTGGRIRVPDKPGLGFDVDPKALRKYGKRFFSAGKLRLVIQTVRDKGIRVAREIDRNRRLHGVGRHTAGSSQAAGGSDQESAASG